MRARIDGRHWGRATALTAVAITVACLGSADVPEFMHSVTLDISGVISNEYGAPCGSGLVALREHRYHPAGWGGQTAGWHITHVMTITADESGRYALTWELQ